MATVTVACKLPNGIILEHGKTRAELKGANTSELVNGFGLTAVDSAFWDAWTAAHADFPALKNGLIFAQSSKSNAKAQTEDHIGIETGLEGIDTKNPGKKAKLSPGLVEAA